MKVVRGMKADAIRAYAKYVKIGVKIKRKAKRLYHKKQRRAWKDERN